MEKAKIIKYPLSTEKSIRLMQSENKMAFIVERRARKREIKAAVEDLFSAKVVKINTTIGPDGKKKAYVQFSDKTPALEIATKLGLM